MSKDKQGREPKKPKKGKAPVAAPRPVVLQPSSPQDQRG
jgi:hypothetical protein